MIFNENKLSFDFRNYHADKGQLLISEPYLQDACFKRTVILMAVHNQEEGSLGFIINKPTYLQLNQVIKSFADIQSWPVYFGGPVQTSSLFYIHTLGDLVPESRQITDEIYFGGNFDVLKELVLKNEVRQTEVKFFMGYSGWSQNQLEEEIQLNSWLSISASKKIVFSNKQHNELWRMSVAKTKQHFFLANFPEDVAMN